MSILIVVEHDNKEISLATRSVVQAALQIDSNLTLLVAGYQCDAVVEQAASIAGVQTLLHADDICYQHFIAEPFSKLVHYFAGDFTHILVASSTFGKNILARSAALLDVTQVTDVIKIE